MKTKNLFKLLCLGLALLLTLGLSACGDSDTADSSSAVSSQPKTTYYNGTSEIQIDKKAVMDAVATGTMDVTYSTGEDVVRNVPVTLGKSAEDTFNSFEGDFKRYEKDKYIYYDNHKSRIYFLNDGTNSGVIAISTFSMAFNFEPNVMKKTDVNAIMGKADKEGDLPKELMSSLFHGQKETFYSYISGNNTITFCFNENDYLSATIISANGKWMM